MNVSALFKLLITMCFRTDMEKNMSRLTDA
jgi:hypothetical protein